MEKQLKYNLLFFFAALLISIVITILLWVFGKTVEWDIKEIYYFILPLILSTLASLLKYIANKILIGQKWYHSLNKIMKDERVETIRISFAYLYRIFINGKYLLVKNERGTDRFQPVGGAYKCNNEEKTYLASSFCVADDNCIKIDESSINDYRMRVPKKALKKFIKRFDNTKNRENIEDLSREFKEELLKAEIDLKDFNIIEYRYCGRHFSDLTYTKFNCYELLIADIIELKPSESQSEVLKETQNVSDGTKYRWADESQVISYGMEVGTNKLKDDIADHTFKILQRTESTLIKNKLCGRVFQTKL